MELATYSGETEEADVVFEDVSMVQACISNCDYRSFHGQILRCYGARQLRNEVRLLSARELAFVALEYADPVRPTINPVSRSTEGSEVLSSRQEKAER